MNSNNEGNQQYTEQIVNTNNAGINIPVNNNNINDSIVKNDSPVDKKDNKKIKESKKKIKKIKVIKVDVLFFK